MSEPDPRLSGVPEVPVVEDGRVGVLRPLRVRDFTVLRTGMTVSMIGDGLANVALADRAIQFLSLEAT